MVLNHSLALQVTRGGRVKLREISQPTTDDWGTALEAIQVLLGIDGWRNIHPWLTAGLAGAGKDCECCIA